MFDLTGKTALVTGASGGIGGAIAKALHGQGATVVLSGTRQDALEIVKLRDGKFPWSYLGKPLQDILDPLDMSVAEFVQVCDRFTNRKIFKRDASGALIKDRHGNLSKLNFDNP